MRYQQAAEDGDAVIAAALSGFAEGNVVALRPKRNGGTRSQTKRGDAQAGHGAR
jgi:hypothetical protein